MRIFKKPWSKLDYLNNNLQIYSYKYSEMMVELHARMVEIDPSIKELGHNPPPVIVPATPLPKRWLFGPLEIIGWNGESAFASFYSRSNVIQAPAGGKFIEGKLHWLAWHEYGHWILARLSTEHSHDHPEKWKNLFDRTWRD